jgi:CRISPR-associated endonuclease/helicase Cas3
LSLTNGSISTNRSTQPPSCARPMNDIPAYAAHHRKADDHWQTVLEHLLGVASLSTRSAIKLKLGRMGELLGLLHDLGKYSQEFQAHIKSAIGALNQDEDEDWVDAASLKGKVDHSTAGAQWAWQALAGRGEMAMVAGQVAALCIASHHSTDFDTPLVL